MLLEKLHDVSTELMAALEAKDAEAIKKAQPPFTETVEEVWQAFEAGKIKTHVRGKALPLTLYGYATKELPLKISNSDEWPHILRELKNMQNLSDYIISPEENE